MRRIKAPAYFLPLFLSMFFLTSITATQPLRAQGQAPAAGTSLTVRMIEGIDSSKDPPGKQYRASVTKAVDAGNGVRLCRYQGQQDGHFIIYVTPIIHWSLAATDISVAFNRYMSANYDINKITAGSGYCQTVSYSADQQAYTMQQLEKQWADSKTVVTHLDWTATPDEIAADNAKLSAKAANAPARQAAHLPSWGPKPCVCPLNGG